MGLGLGDDHMTAGTDMIMCKATASGVGECEDMTAVGEMAPVKDTTQNTTAVFSVADAAAKTTNVEIRRALDTGDAQDYVFQLDTEFEMCWATNTESSDFTAYHTGAGRGGAMYSIKSDGTSNAATYPEADSDAEHSSHEEDNAVATVGTMAAALTVATVLIM